LIGAAKEITDSSLSEIKRLTTGKKKDLTGIMNLLNDESAGYARKWQTE